MGYYTKHDLKLKTEVSKEKMKEIEEYIYQEELHWEINSFDGEEILRDAEEGNVIYLADEPSKWYDSSNDMKKMSAEFKNVLFELYGEGEESGDIWKAYYLNGKEQRVQARLTFDEFDESKLN